MCDTLYVGPEAGGSAFFGKNSDRHPAEAQALCILPRRPAAKTTAVGALTFDIADPGYAVALSRPIWMPGGEMGLNEKGLAIGNEAVFSRYKPAKDGVLGMALLRAALMACSSAAEARDFLSCWVENHDQGGNGTYWGKLYYDNSFIIADGREAFILETAGRRWAWRPAERRDAISNAYCITEDYKRLDTQTRKAIAPVNERAACSDEADPGRKGSKESWRANVEDRKYLFFTKGDIRRRISLRNLGAGTGGAFGAQGASGGAPGEAPILSMFAALSSHGNYDPAKPHSRHMESICVHAGGIPRTATTASMAVEWRPDGTAILWYTGSSCPCLSLYKPVILAGGEFTPLCEGTDFSEESPAGYKAWARQHKWIARHNHWLKGMSLCADAAFNASRSAAQAELALIADRAAGESRHGILRREAGAIIAGWEKDVGLR